MGYRVISRFFDRARNVYVDPGTPCPALDPAEAKRLVAANCLDVVADEPSPAVPPRRRRDVPAAPETPAPPAAGE
ncbi:MAG: hypothetical protein K8T90_01735 [Planctomycetes bacterium]|nr:hypothetical protein [Planctomycetota bacterium]